MDSLFEIRALNYFGVILQMMFNFPEIVPRNVYDCGSRDHEGELSVYNILGHQGVGGGYRLPGKELFENLGAKTKGLDAL